MKEVIVSAAFNKRIISHLRSSRPVDSSNTNFVLKGSKDFTSRSKDVFGELKSLESAHQSWITENKIHDNFQNSDDLDSSECNRSGVKSAIKTPVENCGVNKSSDVSNHNIISPPSTSLFKKPQCTKISKRKSNFVPNFLKRRKWTKYSLEDTPLTSNAANTSIALGFIEMLRKRKADEQKPADTNDGKIIFSKPLQKETCNKIISSKSGKDLISESVKKLKTESVHVKLDHLESECD